MKYLDDYDKYILLSQNDSNIGFGFSESMVISRKYSKFINKHKLTSKPNLDLNYTILEITKYIMQYIKNNNLQNSNNKRIIIPNSELCELLGFDKSSDGMLKFTNLQKYISNLVLKNNDSIKKETLITIQRIKKEINDFFLNFLDNGLQPVKDKLNLYLTHYYFKNPEVFFDLN